MAKKHGLDGLNFTSSGISVDTFKDLEKPERIEYLSNVALSLASQDDLFDYENGEECKNKIQANIERLADEGLYIDEIDMERFKNEETYRTKVQGRY